MKTLNSELVCLLSASLVSAGLLENSAFQFGKNSYQVYTGVKSWQGKAALGYDSYLYCQASGASNCPVFAGLCFAYNAFLESKIATNFILASFSDVLANQYCLGEPTLKCCRETSGGFCWSAFNQPSPINCEGNPAYILRTVHYREKHRLTPNS
jgi:hypothetical protein